MNKQYSKEELKGSSKKRKKKRVGYFYALDNNFSKINNNSPIKNEIICGDSLEILKKLPDNCIDLIFTSPPYNFGKDYGDYDDNKTNKEYFNKLFEILKECVRITKWGGRIAINLQPLFSDFIPTHHMVTSFMIEQKMIWRNEILWNKNNRNVHYSCWGSYRSSSSPYMKSLFEFIEVYSKGDIKHEVDHKNDDMQKIEFSEWLKTGMWSIAPEHKMKEFGHPAMFPEELAYRVLKLFSAKTDLILDPFMGLGTTCVVAKRTGRNFIGIDIDQNYCCLSNKRLENVEIEEFILKE